MYKYISIFLLTMYFKSFVLFYLFTRFLDIRQATIDYQMPEMIALMTETFYSTI